MPAAGYELRSLVLRPLPRGRPVAAARAIATDLRAATRARALISELHPDAVVGAGGYVAGPVGLAAALARVPLVLMEADGHLGITNRLLAPCARRVCLAVPIPGREGSRYRVTGRPVPEPVSDRVAARARFGIAADERCVLVFGGSQGARSINLSALEAFAGAGFHVLHAAGERDLDQLRSPGPHYDLRGWIEDLRDAIAASDLVVARAGGSVWEVAAHGRPMVLIPYPFSAGAHQERNAEVLAREGAAVVIDDRQLTGSRLANEVGRLLADPGRMAAMGRAAAAVARPHAAREVADEVLAAAGLRPGAVAAAARGSQ